MVTFFDSVFFEFFGFLGLSDDVFLYRFGYVWNVELLSSFSTPCRASLWPFFRYLFCFTVPCIGVAVLSVYNFLRGISFSRA